MKLTFLTVVAEAAARAPQAPDQQLLDLDATVLVMLGLFLLTSVVLTQWLWKPYLRVREERVGRVDGYRQEAARLETEAKTRLAHVEAKLADARRAGSSERARARTEAQAREQAILAEAQAAAARSLAEARARLDSAFAAEQARLHERASALGREIGEKVLGRGVTS
jgi:F0F1-type ATP synthase membrane subunit b/b'